MVNLYILINIERVSKHSVTILAQRVVTPAGLEPGQIVPSPSKRVGLRSPLAASSMYGDLICCVHTVNNFHCFVIIKRMYVYVPKNHMLDWQLCQICYPLEIKLLLTDWEGGEINKAWKETDETEKNSPSIKTCLKDNIVPFPGIKICWGPRQWAFYSNITSS